MEVYVDGSYGFSSDGQIRGGVGIYLQKAINQSLCITIYQDKITRLDNQATEAIAVYIALWLTEGKKKVSIYSDCQHTVSSLTEWYQRFEKSGWTTTKNKPVAHRDILRACAAIIKNKSKKGLQTNIVKVVGHCGIHGNTEADKLAHEGMVGIYTDIASKKISLYYSADICNNVASNIDLVELKDSIRSPKQFTVYRDQSEHTIANHWNHLTTLNAGKEQIIIIFI